MTDKEAKELVDSVYPVDKQRWFKILIKDQDKVMKALPWTDKHVDEHGYRVMAITMRDDYSPQVSGLIDIKDEILNDLSQSRYYAEMNGNNELVYMYDNMITRYKTIIDNKIKEINSRTIYENEKS